MVWSKDTSQGYESDKIAAHVVQYTRGIGLDLGCGTRPVWPHCIGVDDSKTFGGQTAAVIQSNIAHLPMFAKNSLDFVFSSHALEDFEESEVEGVLAEWARVLKVGGYLVLYVPSANLYPLCGTEGANPRHQWNIYPGSLKTKLKSATNCGWDQVEDEERGQSNEYSLFEVYQKRNDGQFFYKPWQRNPEGKKRALVIRYGAIGDQIMAVSPLKGLKDQGYHITYNTVPKTQQVVENNPYIDEYLIQDTDQVPNAQLGPYWESLKERYDLIVNLCESIEGKLLALPGRMEHTYSQETSRRLLNKNYLEHTHDLAGTDYDFDARFYPTAKELAAALKYSRSFDGPIVVWAINGTSAHKVYPFTQTVISWLLEKTPAYVFILTDQGIGKALQDAIFENLQDNGIDTSRVIPMDFDWSIRQSMAFARIADCVVGPETGILNAVGMEDVGKVIYLSHSSAENLTKHWVNTTVLEPENCPCYPCHKMHYNWDYCPQVKETGAALCASNVKPDSIFKAIMHTLAGHKAVE